jgi:hypothetical protein
VVIDLGEPEVLEGHVMEFGQGVVGAERPGADFFQERSKLRFRHVLRG